MVSLAKQPVKFCCNCKGKLNPLQIFDDNIEDISKSLAQILLICGVNTVKSFKVKSIIRRAFVYHEKLRTRCSPQAGKDARLNRDDMLQALRIKCSMQRVEAMLTYAIIKRAFKAFFHGKPMTTIANPIGDATAVNTQEAAWLHAAYKTARIFDNYKSAFFWAHKSYEKQINLVYRDLFKRMCARSNPLMVPVCSCRGCSKIEVPGHPKAGERHRKRIVPAQCPDLPEACILCGLQVPKIKKTIKVKLPRPIQKHELNLERCEKCNSPFLICECNIDQLTGELNGECGMDSYKVKWYRVEQDTLWPGSDEMMLKKQNQWENHHCPIDCDKGSSRTQDVCTETLKSNSETQTNSVSTSMDEDDIVENLEKYLKQLWTEQVAAGMNPKDYKQSTHLPSRIHCDQSKQQ